MKQEEIIQAIKEKRIFLYGGTLTDGKYDYFLGRDGFWHAIKRN